MERLETFLPTFMLMVTSTSTAAANSAAAPAAAQSAAVAIGFLAGDVVTSLAQQLHAFAYFPSPLVTVVAALPATPSSLKAARKDMLESQNGDTTNEHIVDAEDTFFGSSPGLRILKRRSSAPARLDNSDSGHHGDTPTADSFSQLSFSSLGSERTGETATFSSSDGKSPFAEAGSWTEAWESWLHPAAGLKSNSTYSRGRHALAAAAAACGFPAQLKRSPQNDTVEPPEGQNADKDEENVKEVQPPGHCWGCLGQNASLAPDDIPFFDKAVVLPRQLDRNMSVSVTMDAGSVLLITWEGHVCYKANPADLDTHVYAANTPMNACDFDRPLRWEQVYPLIPPSYILWRFIGHRYYFRKPGEHFIEKHGGVDFCFTLEDVETRNVATFVIAANGARGVCCSQTLTFSIALTVFSALLSYTGQIAWR